MTSNTRCARLVLLLAAMAAGGDGVAAARDIPLPRPRPAIVQLQQVIPIPLPRPGSAESAEARAAPPQETVASLPESEPQQATAAPEPSACQLQLGAGLATVRPLAPIIGPGECGGTDIVELQSVTLPDKTRVAVTPPATLRCTMAEAVVEWVRDELAPAVAALGSRLRAIEGADSYECRGRNRVPGAKLSEHGRANALDIRAIRLANGRAVALADFAVAREVRERMRQGACARFTTVLGPGSDGAHESHIHLDLAERRAGYRMCQWNLDPPEPASDETVAADIPLPRPRPAANTAGRSPAARSGNQP
jgi:hypothetical protein